MNKYYNDEEISAVSPIIENYVNLFGDDNGVATLNLKSDVKVIVKRDEGLVLHMVLDNPDHFTALPKSLTMAKDFLNVFITSMAKAIDKKRATVDVAGAISKAEKNAENTLLSYVSDNADDADDDDVEVTVNGKAITDPDQKKAVSDEIDAAMDEARKHLKKMFGDWLKSYMG